MNLYPNISNVKKKDKVIKLLLFISTAICLICILINVLTTPNVKWSLIVIASIVYVWTTTLYAIRKNMNFAAHVMIQLIIISALTFAIDCIIGYSGWSITLAIPIVMTVANLSMSVLTIVNRKKYFRFTIYQLLISVLSLIFITIIAVYGKHKVIVIPITAGISLIPLLLTILLCGKDWKEELARFFHI